MDEDGELTQEQKQELAELNVRRQIALTAVRLLRAEKVDPRAPAAVEKYQGQLTSIENQIEAITGRPPDTVIGLQTARLTAVPSNLGR